LRGFAPEFLGSRVVRSPPLHCGKINVLAGQIGSRLTLYLSNSVDPFQVSTNTPRLAYGARATRAAPE
jgi:hypothetical protein